MSRRNPTKYQRAEVRKLMDQGLTYDEAVMKIPESYPDPKCGGNLSLDPKLTNIPKTRKETSRKIQYE